MTKVSWNIQNYLEITSEIIYVDSYYATNSFCVVAKFKRGVMK